MPQVGRGCRRWDTVGACGTRMPQVDVDAAAERQYICAGTRRRPEARAAQPHQEPPRGGTAKGLCSRMKLLVGVLLCSLVLGVSSQRWWTFLKEAGQGTRDMWRAYSDMREANYKNSDKYFHARGNYDAARRGPGGAWAAKVISDARENSQRITDRLKFGDSGHGAEDSKADQAANKWGRSGKDPNHFRPAGLPSKY
uniref:Serum amyloid A protein n=3 Tax=Canis lupus familiaris TaxID=9615 RepID=A0A8P0SJJ9_CANLF